MLFPHTSSKILDDYVTIDPAVPIEEVAGTVGELVTDVAVCHCAGGCMFIYLRDVDRGQTSRGCRIGVDFLGMVSVGKCILP